MAQRCYLIVNPTSGQYSEQKIQMINATLLRHGLTTELLLTANSADAPLFAKRICMEEESPLIIVGGGDGTINGVVNGLTPGRAILGVLPLGTANVLAKELGISSLDEAVRMITRGKTRPLSVGLLEAHGTSTYFFLMAGIGLDGAVVEDVRLGEKKVLGKGAYLLAALRQLANWSREQVEVRADGRTLGCHSVIVCNGSKYGGNFVLAPEADICRPGFQVLCVKEAQRRTYLKLVLTLLSRQLANNPSIEVFFSRELEISGSKPVQVDGDYCCHGPLRITAVENFASIII